jgi:hypothetical protein
MPPPGTATTGSMRVVAIQSTDRQPLQCQIWISREPVIRIELLWAA